MRLLRLLHHPRFSRQADQRLLLRRSSLLHPIQDQASQPTQGISSSSSSMGAVLSALAQQVVGWYSSLLASQQLRSDQLISDQLKADQIAALSDRHSPLCHNRGCSYGLLLPPTDVADGIRQSRVPAQSLEESHLTLHEAEELSTSTWSKHWSANMGVSVPISPPLAVGLAASVRRNRGGEQSFEKTSTTVRQWTVKQTIQPTVSFFRDPKDLCLTPGAAAAAAKVKCMGDAALFLSKYGTHAPAGEVVFGGVARVVTLQTTATAATAERAESQSASSGRGILGVSAPGIIEAGAGAAGGGAQGSASSTHSRAAAAFSGCKDQYPGGDGPYEGFASRVQRNPQKWVVLLANLVPVSEIVQQHASSLDAGDAQQLGRAAAVLQVASIVQAAVYSTAQWGYQQESKAQLDDWEQLIRQLLDSGHIDLLQQACLLSRREAPAVVAALLTVAVKGHTKDVRWAAACALEAAAPAESDHCRIALEAQPERVSRLLDTASSLPYSFRYLQHVGRYCEQDMPLPISTQIGISGGTSRRREFERIMSTSLG